MNAVNALQLLNAVSGLLTVIDQATTLSRAYSEVLAKANSEGRDVTVAELGELRIDRLAALNELDIAIQQARRHEP